MACSALHCRAQEGVPCDCAHQIPCFHSLWHLRARNEPGTSWPSAEAKSCTGYSCQQALSLPNRRVLCLVRLVASPVAGSRATRKFVNWVNTSITQPGLCCTNNVVWSGSCSQTRLPNLSQTYSKAFHSFPCVQSCFCPPLRSLKAGADLSDPSWGLSQHGLSPVESHEIMAGACRGHGCFLSWNCSLSLSLLPSSVSATWLSSSESQLRSETYGYFHIAFRGHPKAALWIRLALYSDGEATSAAPGMAQGTFCLSLSGSLIFRQAPSRTPTGRLQTACGAGLRSEAVARTRLLLPAPLTVLKCRRGLGGCSRATRCLSPAWDPLELEAEHAVSPKPVNHTHIHNKGQSKIFIK